MTFLLGLLLVIAVISSLLLMLVILLQEPKGGGLAAALGGSGMDAIGANVGQVNRFTTTVAGIWMGACLLHAILQPVGADIGAAGQGTGGTGPVKVDAPEPPREPGGGGNPGGGDEPPK